MIVQNYITTEQDIQEALKEIFKDTLQEMLEAEMTKQLGYVQDVCADLETGTITSIIVPGGTSKFMSLFSSSNDIVIPWNKIKCIGEDLILVEYEYNKYI